MQKSFIFLFVKALTEGKISGFSNYLAERRKELDRIGDLKRSWLYQKLLTEKKTSFYIGPDKEILWANKL